MTLSSPKKEKDKGFYAVYVALVPHTQNSTSKIALYGHLLRAESSAVKLFKVILKVESGMSTTESVTCAHIHPSPGTIQDVKFVDDEHMMLAIVDDCRFMRTFPNQ